MLKHIARIQLDIIRIPLLLLVFPFHYLHFVISAWLPVRWGGHPNIQRLCERDFYALPIVLFWATWDGSFVPRE